MESEGTYRVHSFSPVAESGRRPYLACAGRPALGYVDHPPLAAWLLGLLTDLLGESILVLRLVPALASGALVLMTARIARRLGGSRSARLLGAAAVALSTGLIIQFDSYSMNLLEVLLWTLVLDRLLVRTQEDRPRQWIGIGVLLGVGLLVKHTAVLLAIGLLPGLLVSRFRRDLISRPLWLGVAAAFLIFLPNLIWQVQHGFPSLEFYQRAQELKNVDLPWHMVALGQLTFNGITSVVLLVPGILFLLFRRKAAGTATIAVADLVLVALAASQGASRPDRLAGLFPLLLAAGAVAIDTWAARRRWIFRSVAILLVGGSAALLPITSSAMPTRWQLAYAEALGELLKVEQGPALALPQWLSDRRGWKEMADLVATACASLSDDEQARALILADNYGQAGALELFGPRHDLPAVICPHNSYWWWSQGRTDTDVYVTIGFGRTSLERLFDEVELFAALDAPLARENGRQVFLCRRPRKPLSDTWDELRFYV